MEYNLKFRFKPAVTWYKKILNHDLYMILEATITIHMIMTSVFQLVIKCKSKVLLSTYVLAEFEVALADHPLEHKPL